MTGYAWRSGFAAALFAVHPLHVESVAWIAERKDVLSTFFMMLALLAYRRYAQNPGARRYLLLVLLFAMGLLSKPMLVTLPFVLLLLDYWPLGRVARRGGAGPSDASEIPETGSHPPAFGPGRLILEKLPLILLSAASSAATVIAQKGGGAMQSLPLGAKVSNALLAYVKYMGMMFWPKDLAAIYPHPEGSIPLWQTAAAAVLLLVLTFLFLWWGKRRPYLPVGWFWYLGTLVPVIGIVQVGNQAMADRYTYIPLIGLFIILAWGVPDLVDRRRAGERRPAKKQAPRRHPLAEKRQAGKRAPGGALGDTLFIFGRRPMEKARLRRGVRAAGTGRLFPRPGQRLVPEQLQRALIDEKSGVPGRERKVGQKFLRPQKVQPCCHNSPRNRLLVL